MIVAQALLVIAGLYALVGAAVGCAFVFRGINSADQTARTAGTGFRLMILPGSAMLWPLTLRLWLRPALARQSSSSSSAHAHGGDA